MKEILEDPARYGFKEPKSVLAYRKPFSTTNVE
jgi:hypothetical protein